MGTASRINVKLVLELLSKGMSARELGVPGLLEAIDMVEGDPSYAGLAFADKAKVVIDTLDTAQMHFMLELTERRYDNSSTIYCTQYPVDDWHRRMGGGAHADSVMDRIIHNAIRIEMGDVNMREPLAKRG